MRAGDVFEQNQARQALAPQTASLRTQQQAGAIATTSYALAAWFRFYMPEDVPVVQLSIDATQPPQYHFEIGRRLAQLREEGVLIFGSGNLVHNLRAYAWGVENAPAYPWAEKFEAEARGLAYLDKGDIPHAIRFILLPAALPGFLAGLEQGWAFSWRSLMAAELIAVSPVLGPGLGQMLDTGRTLGDMPLVLGAILLILTVGVAVERLVFAPIRHRVLRNRGLGRR